jgi:hypothetical protein
MTDEQIQALEALYTAAHGRCNRLCDLDRLAAPIAAIALDELRLQGYIVVAGRGHFMITWHGINKVTGNQPVPPVDS